MCSRASLTLQETRSIHDSMNIPKIDFISLILWIRNNVDSDQLALIHQNQFDLDLHCFLKCVYVLEINIGTGPTLKKNLQFPTYPAIYLPTQNFL